MNVIERNPLMSMVICALVVAMLSAAGWVAVSYFEANAYNRATGSHVSTWDAMWIELRVQAAPKE